MLTAEQFLCLVEEHLERKGISASRFGKEAVGDPKFVFDLREGRSPSLRNVNRILTAIGAADEQPPPSDSQAAPPPLPADI